MSEQFSARASLRLSVPKLPPNGRARKCAYFMCRRPTVTHPLCDRHRWTSWIRAMYGLVGS